MFNFTGSARRQRQVNLSGTNTSGGRRPGSSSTINSAREQRAIREAERTKLRSAIKIQSLFRGHVTRKNVRHQLQRDWDHNWERDGTTNDARDIFLIEQLSRLLSFYRADDKDDRKRLTIFIKYTRQFKDSTQSEHMLPKRTQAQSDARVLALLRRYMDIILDSVLCLQTGQPKGLLQQIEEYFVTLLHIRSIDPTMTNKKYYVAMSAAIQNLTELAPTGLNSSTSQLVTAVVFDPLRGNNLASVHQNCKSFVLNLLTKPAILTALSAVSEDWLSRGSVPIDTITNVIPIINVDTLPTQELLSLLAHIVYIESEQRHRSREYVVRKETLLNFVSCLSWLLGTISSKISTTRQSGVLGVYNAQKSARATVRLNIEASGKTIYADFEFKQFDLLQSQTFIKEIFAIATSNKPNSTRTQSISITAIAESEEASILANYMLMLSLVFPSCIQDIRRSLYIGQTYSGESLVKYFWRHVSGSRVFNLSVHDMGYALKSLCQGPTCKPQPELSSSEVGEWRTIFLFLEIFFFALLVMDDEEFFSGSEKALKLSELNTLSIFLKNIGFITFWNVKEIEQGGNDIEMIDVNHTDQPSSGDQELRSISARDGIAGVKGISLPWLRNLTVRLLRMIYTRDSRQRFLPVDHWLMTKEVGMDGFIPAVVAEEEARQFQMTQNNDADSSDEESEVDVDSAPANSVSSYLNNRRSTFRAGFNHQKMARGNQLAAITPRLEILQNLPFFIPFKTRVEIFREFIIADQLRRRNGFLDADSWRLSVLHRNPMFPGSDGRVGRHHGRISRVNVFEDAFHEFYGLGEGLKEPIQITFIDSFGAEEAGIDGGGVTKEFLTSVAKEAFQGNTQDALDDQSDESLFIETDENTLYPNPVMMELVKAEVESANWLYQTREESAKQLNDAMSEVLKRYEFLGRIVGKCLYEGILVDVVFAEFFLLKWSKAMTAADDGGLGIDDLKALDRGLWKGLQALKHYDSATIDALSLTFSTEVSISYKDAYKNTKTKQKILSVNLKENGSNIAVTIGNRLEYMHLLARHHLTTQSRAQTNAFVTGLSSIVSPRWLTMFNQSELQTLVGGNDSPINVEDLRRNTTYGGVYTIGDDGLEHPTVAMFWNVMNRLADIDRQAVLKFVTSVSRAPLLGFSALSPLFCIRDAGSDEDRLPSTSTCVNLLKLPRYSSETVLSEKLLYAVRSGAGFDLS